VKNFKVDKTYMKAQSFKEADADNLFSKDVSIADRLRMAFHLTCKIYGLDEKSSLKIDKSIFTASKFV
jgi:hypothetical protein